MITRLHIENFKSLEDLWLPAKSGEPLARLVVLVGVNGSGKSTLLQAFDFLGQLVLGRVEEWLDARGWKSMDLASAFSPPKRRVITFSVTWLDQIHGEITWSGRYNTLLQRCTNEQVYIGEQSPSLLHVKDQTYSVQHDEGSPSKPEPIPFDYEGSILSGLKLELLHPALRALKHGLLGLKSLELLSPHLMRKRAKAAVDVGVGGEKLSAFLSRLSPEKIEALNTRLKTFYPHLRKLHIKSLKAGWKDLRVQEKYGWVAEFSAANLNDGLLRVVGILAQAHSDHSVVLFDEIENGINQQLAAMLVDFLIELSKERQVVVTTHSPLLLNYLPDDVARAGVILLYKNDRGATQARRFFDLEEVQWKLKGLGPGEAFADTDLLHLADTLAGATGGDQ